MADNIQIEISAHDSATGTLNGLNAALGKVDDTAKGTVGTFTELNQTLELARKAWQALQVAFRVVTTIAEARDQFIKLELALTVLSGSSNTARQSMAWIVNFAKTAPVDIGTLSRAFIQLSATGIDPTKGSMRALLDAVIASGGGMDEFRRAIIAVQQISGKGVVSMEELRQQLGEAIPSAARIMAKELGLTLPELFAKIAQGALSADEGLGALFKGLEKTFGGAAAKQMETYAGAVSLLATNWSLLLNEMGKTWVYDLAAKGVKLVSDAFKAQADQVAANNLAIAIRRLGGDALISGLKREELTVENLSKIYDSLTYSHEQEKRAASKRAEATIAQNAITEVASQKALKLANAFATVARAQMAATAQQVLSKEALDISVDGLDEYVDGLEDSHREARALAGALASLNPILNKSPLIDTAKVEDALGTWQRLFETLLSGFGGVGRVVGAALNAYLAAKNAAGATGTPGADAAMNAASAAKGGFWAVLAQVMFDLFQQVPSFKAAMDKLFKALVDLVAPIAEMLVPLLEELVPLVKAFVPIIKMFLPLLHLVVEIIKNNIAAITSLINFFRPMFDLISNLTKALESVNLFGGSGGGGLGGTIGGAIGGTAGDVIDAVLPFNNAPVGGSTIIIQESLNAPQTAERVRMAIEELTISRRLATGPG